VSRAPLASALYEGWVRHRRFAPVRHDFRYRVFLVYLDLGELDRVFRGRWLWSASRPNLAWLDRRLHLGDPEVPLDRAVRDLVAERLGRRPEGPIRLLTHLTYFGCGFNPVSFYYCYDRDGARLDALVGEVNNTPWNEQYPYVLDARAPRTLGPPRPGKGRVLGWRFPKAFHVSPFMPLAQEYHWRFLEPGARLAVHMENLEGGERLFDATLSLERREVTGPALARVLALHPFMTVKVIAAIYWNALRLWAKRAPYHQHPGSLPPGGRRLAARETP
jgi:DUF1365 family protein